jgi:hypothetical protein
VVLTTEDPYAQLASAAPGVYHIVDAVRGTVENIEVQPNGSHAVLQSKPLDLSAGGAADAPPRSDSPWDVQRVALGERYFANVPTQDGTQLLITPGGIYLVLFMDEPEPHEIQQVTAERIATRLVTTPHCMLFLLRAGDAPWRDAPYSPPRLRKTCRFALDGPKPGYGWMLNVILVDIRTGLVRGLRKLALSNAFSHATARELAKQCAEPADDAAYVAEYVALVSRSTEDLAEMATDRFEQGKGAS